MDHHTSAQTRWAPPIPSGPFLSKTMRPIAKVLEESTVHTLYKRERVVFVAEQCAEVGRDLVEIGIFALRLFMAARGPYIASGSTIHLFWRIT